MRKGIHSYISQKLEKQMNGLPICILSMSLTFIDRYSEGKIGNYAIIHTDQLVHQMESSKIPKAGVFVNRVLPKTDDFCQLLF